MVLPYFFFSAGNVGDVMQIQISSTVATKAFSMAFGCYWAVISTIPQDSFKYSRNQSLLVSSCVAWIWFLIRHVLHMRDIQSSETFHIAKHKSFFSYRKTYVWWKQANCFSSVNAEQLLWVFSLCNHRVYCSEMNLLSLKALIFWWIFLQLRQ